MQDTLWTIIEPVVRDAGLELWDVDIVKEGGRRVVQVQIDRPTGVTLEDCRAVSRRVSDVLDEVDPLPDNYTLEVASPGVERKLRNRADLERFHGCLALITTTQAVAGEVRHEGRLQGVEGDHVLLQVGGGAARSIPISAIRCAHLLFEAKTNGHPDDDDAADQANSAGGERGRA